MVRKAVDHGVIPWEDPEVNKYWVLLSEDQQQKFKSEIEELWLTLENDTDVNH